jgi:predicted transcriptional regulator of viral defense system
MKIQELNKIRKLYFGYRELARVLGITEPSAKVLAARYASTGVLVRLKRNIYVPADRWRNLSREELFQLANILQVPSYISLMTALEHYGVTTQVQRGVVESLAVKRTVEYEVEGRMFLYSRISKDLYGGFTKAKGYFIASAEKALLDTVYMSSFSKYRFDASSLDITKLDRHKVNEQAKDYPAITRKKLDELWKS